VLYLDTIILILRRNLVLYGVLCELYKIQHSFNRPIRNNIRKQSILQIRLSITRAVKKDVEEQ